MNDNNECCQCMKYIVRVVSVGSTTSNGSPRVVARTSDWDVAQAIAKLVWNLNADTSAFAEVVVRPPGAKGQVTKLLYVDDTGTRRG
jgi:hypothetical protein